LGSGLLLVTCGVTEISSINFAGEAGSGEVTTCLLLVKLSGLNVEQLLRKTKNAMTGKICLTITSFF
jgi:hypothetical protein